MKFDDAFLKSLESLLLLARRLQAGPLPGERTTPRAGASLEFREHRSYTPGDDLRYVDWNVFARHGQLHVKQFAAERDLQVLVAADVSASMGFWGKREQALSVAAALGYVALARGDTLSWAAFAERRLAGAEGLRGKSRAVDLLRGLEAAPAGAGPTRVAAAGDGRARGLVVVISDFCDRATREALRGLRPRGGGLVAIHVVAEEEIRPPVAGAVRLVDAETGEEADADIDEAALDRYRAATQARWDALAAFCARESVPFQRVVASTPLREVVAALLRPGGALSRR
ncbi:MAG: DUF58 domain-containing protein [Planctomycetes bacterium]|nr:DUF58 domain-containing protein [Planctomycetota bacterium]